MINYLTETETTYPDNKNQLIPETASKCIRTKYVLILHLSTHILLLRAPKVRQSVFLVFLFKHVNSSTLKINTQYKECKRYYVSNKITS